MLNRVEIINGRGSDPEILSEIINITIDKIEKKYYGVIVNSVSSFEGSIIIAYSYEFTRPST